MPRKKFLEEEEWEESPEEEVPLKIPKEFLNIGATLAKFKVSELWTGYLSGTICLEPDFQRHWVWDDERASRFIESLLLDLPVPPIFLAEAKDGRFDIIDGHQRLETLFRFLQPLGSPIEKAEVKPRLRPLTLNHLRILSDKNGSDITGLHVSDRKKLLDKEIITWLIPKTAHPTIKYDLFARINLGAMPLNNQELRNCLYRGPYNKLIRDLAEHPDTLSFFGRRMPHKRMKDREAVLRFFAISHRFEQYEPPFQEFLNKEMEENQNCSPEDITKFNQEFWQAMEWTRKIFRGNALKLFRMGNDSDPDGYWDRRMDLIYEVEMVGFNRFGELLKQTFKNLSGADQEYFSNGLRYKLVRVMLREDFLRTLLEGTRRPSVMRLRHSLWDKTLEEALKTPEKVIKETKEIITKLRQSDMCTVCFCKIGSFEDTVFRVVPEKGLAHTWCAEKEKKP